MKVLFAFLVSLIPLMTFGQYEIIRTKLSGMGVQADSAWWIIGFQTETDGEYVYLRPIRQGNVLLQPILRSRLWGTGVQSFTTAGDTLVGFSTSGPDGEGYVYLNAMMKSGATQAIFRSKLEGCDVQGVPPVAGQWINKFRTTSDGEYVYIIVGQGVIGIEEKKSDSERRVDRFIFALKGASPNPFTKRTRISYSIGSPCKVNLLLYDVAGRLVRMLKKDEMAMPGIYHAEWCGEDDKGRIMGNGVYFAKLEAGEFSATRKLLILR